MNNVMRVDFNVGVCNSDGKVVSGTEEIVSILYNRTVISDDKVKELINSGMYKYDIRLVVTTPTRADNLKGIFSNENNETLTTKEFEIIMNALLGYPTLTTAKFADKVQRILKQLVK